MRSKKDLSPYGGLSPFVRSQIKDKIEQLWSAELCKRELAGGNSTSVSPEVAAYYAAWKKASTTKDIYRADHYIEQAYEMWQIALMDDPNAKAVLGPMHRGVNDFEFLPTPSQRTKKTRADIQDEVFRHFKAHPEEFDGSA